MNEAIKNKGLTQAKLAEMVGRSANTVWRWCSGDNDPDDKMKAKIAEILGVSVSYLMGENKTEVVAAPTNDMRLRVIRSAIEVPVLSSMSSVCGGRGFDLTQFEAEIQRYELIPEEWLRGYPREPYSPYVVYVEGESMEPVIQDGERILVNPNDRELAHERIFVVRWNDNTKIRKVILNRNGDIILRAYNPAYKDDVILAEDAEYTFEVCGRVLRYLGIDRLAE